MSRFRFLFPTALLSLLFSLPAAAYTVKATAVDTTGQAEEFATWRIFALPDTTKAITGAVAGTDGVIEASLSKAGDYKLNVVGMSSKPANVNFSLTDSSAVLDLGKIVLMPATEQLRGITVSAQRPLVTKEIDRIAYDVSADSETPTSTLNQILRKVPMVSVDDDGSIKVNGSSDFKIYRNGRPSSSFSKNAKEIFKAIPASSIRKIEVITDPGAREDAEGVGAILNIVTESNVSLKGVMGSIYLNFSSNNAVPAPNAFIQSQIGKVTFSVSGGYFNASHRQMESESSIVGQYQSTGNNLEQTNRSSGRNDGGYGNLELSYEIDTLNLITAEASIFSYNARLNSDGNTRLFNADGTDIYRFSTHTYYPTNDYLDLEGAVNYQRSTRRKGETITLSYQISTTAQNNREETEYFDILNPPMDYTGINARSHLNFIEHTGQIDWSRPYGKIHILDLGAKFIQRNNNTDSHREYIGTPNTAVEDFVHRTSIAAAYADYRVKVRKFNIRAGIRYEFSRLSAKYKLGDQQNFGSNLNDFAPNAAVSYNINDANTLKLSYNRRISRPGVYYLNPTVSETPLTTSQGNPHLKSANYDRVGLEYSLFKAKFMLNLGANYSYTGDAIGQVKRVVDQHSYYTYDNLNQISTLGVNTYIQWSPFDKTSIIFNGNIQRTHYNTLSLGLKANRWSGSMFARVQQKLPWALTLSGYLNYWSGFGNGVYSYGGNSFKNAYYGFSLNRSFIKDRLTANLSVNNPFGAYTLTNTTHNVNSDFLSTETSRSFHRFTVNLGISYRFGSLKAQVKKTAASINNDDLSGRKQ